MRTVLHPLRVIMLATVLTATGAVAAGCADGPSPISRTPVTSTTLFATGSANGPVTVSTNVFHPEGQDLSNCRPAIERPGCGSKAKGGWRMTLVFAVLMLGIAVVVSRIVRSARARSRAVNHPTGDWS